MSKRIVFTTFGSLGDLHPYMALALGLQARGHRAILATSAMYREKVEAEGIGFHAVRPDVADFLDRPDLMQRATDLRTGTEYVVRQMVIPHLRRTYEDLVRAVDGADMLITHPLTYAGPLVAQKLGICWVSSILQPIGFMSIYDPPALAPAPVLTKLRRLGPALYGPLFRFMRWTVRSWMEPVRRLRAEIGLPPSAADPMFEGQFSPFLNLALFSEVMGAAQPDWPPNTVVTGFPFYDRDLETPCAPPELLRFLESGPPPVVFTLGSSAVMDAGSFYTVSAEAVRRLGMRAVLLVGREPQGLPEGPLPKGVVCFDYAPYSELFPRAAIIVHQGGIGTTGQALRAGRPMLVMPYSHDQPDNAERVTRLGIALTISRKHYSVDRVISSLRQLLNHPGYATRAAQIGLGVQAEDGVKVACDAILQQPGCAPAVDCFG